MIKNLLLLSLVVCFSCCSKPMNNEKFKECLTTLSSYNKLYNEGNFTAEDSAKLKAYLQEFDSKYDIKKVNYKQMLTLLRYAHINIVSEWIMPSLTKMAEQKSDSSCLLQFAMYNLEGKDAPLTFERYMKILSNPYLMIHLSNSNFVLKLVSKIEMNATQTEQLIRHIMPHIDSKVAVFGFYALTSEVWGKILAAGEAFPKELKEEYYQKVLAAMREIIDEDKDLNVNNLKETYASFNTLYARGELIGSIAPELDFIWNSAGMELKNLSDLRGKIVIVDFWATWCTPCVRSFPNIRKLQERYKDYPVVFIGVTSIQGRHIDRVNNKTIDTKGDPEKELNLMKVFIKNQNMTWNVAFTKQKVYNPDYGVRGIPHIAIIDTEGKVRYNKINPGSAPYEEAEKIDALLKEAGLKYPTQPMEKRNYAAEAAASTKK